ncbi:hypothetical protein LIER_24551 [Lithospermum erythrorhizon]|uniref:Uncharacterized protein n=1 Tax=Lithospermum erythrorhizon TaxID=34254 RepID=A0AAV3R305_LITER
MYQLAWYRKYWDGPLLTYVAIEDVPKFQPKEQSKLSPKWQGSYRVKRVVGPSTYELDDLDGKAVPRTWHASNLCRYYV